MQRFTSHRCSLSTCSKAMFFRIFLNFNSIATPYTRSVRILWEQVSDLKGTPRFKKVNVLNLLWVYRWYEYLYIYYYILTYLSTDSAKWIIMVPVPPVYVIRFNSIYPAPWWSWCVTACRLSTVSGCASSPHWQSRGLWGPGPKWPVCCMELGSMRSRCRTARTLPSRAARKMFPSPRPGQQRRCSPRRQSGWPFTVWANCWQLWCRNRWKIQFFGSALQSSS